MRSLLKGYLTLSRLPFHLVGIFPFLLGSVLSWSLFHSFNWSVFFLGIFATILIMLSTYYIGEYYDFEVDRLSALMERNRFSGGTQVLQKGLVPPSHAKIGAHITALLAIFIGLILQFHYNTGYLTIPLGIIGLVSGFFYSAPPFRWVSRGIGEILIGICYGWLPVATAFYLQTGKILEIVNWISIPIAVTIFNVILINEFPDYPADIIKKKKNLLVRIGKESGALLYILMTLISWISFLLSFRKGIPLIGIIAYTPVFIIIVILVLFMLQKRYLDRDLLEKICAMTIFVNLGTTTSYIIAIGSSAFI